MGILGPVVKKYPAGALRSLEQLQSVLDIGSGVTLYYVNGLGKVSSYTEYVTSATTHIRTCDDKDSAFLEQISYKDDPSFPLTKFSLLDANVCRQNGYNDHFLFDSKFFADQYVDWCKNSIEQEVSIQAHWAWCDEAFRDLD